ncbi:MAG: hypothetical protein KIT16_18755 [Rhodospirillaceae bacterium]|nr:hypothetical protein [Rhodospirillaceae bacterium]
MKKLVLPLAAAILFAAAGSASAGKIYFTAYQDGKQASVKNPKTKKTTAGSQIEVVTQATYEKMSAKRKKQYSAVDMCGATYYLTKRGADWKKAHETAQHEIRVRDHVKKNTYSVICPKEAAAPPDKKKMN